MYWSFEMMTADLSGPGDVRESLTYENLVGDCVTLARAAELHVRSKSSFWTDFIFDLRAPEEVRKK